MKIDIRIGYELGGAARHEQLPDSVFELSV